jgi:acyl-CoA thioesterase-1
LLAERLAAGGWPAEVVNAGVSGDTTAGGLARLDWILSQRPDLVVVELGANDGLRCLPLEASEANLRAIVEGSRAAGAEVLLLAMRLPPNYGADYTRSFEAIYPRVAAEEGATLVPFFLAGIAGQPELNLPDGIHPNAAGHRRAAENLLPHVAAAVEEAS